MKHIKDFDMVNERHNEPITVEEFKNKLTQMKSLFEDIEDIYLTLPDGLQNIINDFHNYEGSLGHCYGAGITACDELTGEADKLIRKFENEY